jgi:hypothetical protein
MNFRPTVQNIAAWMSAVRDLEGPARTRALDAHWLGQLESKAWLVDTVEAVAPGPHPHAAVFGGWTGVLSSMLLQSEILGIEHLTCTDLDPTCQATAQRTCEPYFHAGQFTAQTADMRYYRYPWDRDTTLVVNTVCEHVDQATYDAWLDQVPVGSVIVVQGNNFFDCAEHVRCSRDLAHFCLQQGVRDPLYTGHIDTVLYRRFMAVWKK